jgi:Uma2 family endonuclease
MATAPTLPLVPVDEYLNTSYEQDFEFVDGVLIEKGVPTIYHQMLSAVLLRWFYQYGKQFRIKALADVRTQIIERAKYRLPDIMVFTVPMELGRVMTAVPDVVIEIQSPNDLHSEIMARFEDYHKIGVRHLIHMDPEKFYAWRYVPNPCSLIFEEFQSLDLPGRGNLPFDSISIFANLRQEIADCLP